MLYLKKHNGKFDDSLLLAKYFSKTMLLKELF